MNKKYFLITIASLVLAAGVVYTVTTLVSRSQQIARQNAEKSVNACDLLTLDEAKTLLGDTAVLGEHSEPENDGSISLSNCSYSNGARVLEDIRAISFSARTALDQKGINGNVTAFQETNGKAVAGDEAVAGYGDKAFWSTDTRHLSILRGDVWIRIWYGGNEKSIATLENTKQVADLILAK